MTENIPLRPAWVEIDLSAIEHNARRLTEIAGRGVELMTMVKANAYGHGAVEVARAALRGGATWLGVVSVGEGIELRRANIDAPILVLGPTPPDWARAGVENQLALAAFSIDTVRAMADAARELKARARIHIKVDTGMTRLGVLPAEAVDFARAACDLGNVEIEGIFTHFAMADMPDAFDVKGYTHQQLARFHDVLDQLERAGIQPRYRHIANSPASVNLPAARFNLVRSGILIYGLDPSDDAPKPPGFIPAFSFKTRVASLKSVPAGTFVGYGCTFRTERASRIAVLMVGYADGFRRALSNAGSVLVRGTRAPIVGRVCMDLTMIDVTDIADVQASDEVVLIGKQGTEEISAEEVARNQGTNNYETVTTISARVERRYIS